MKFSWILGSSTALLSFGTAIAPLAVFFGGPLGALLLFLYNFSCGLPINLLTRTGLPYLIAGWYLRQGRAVRAGLPLLCMLFFALEVGWNVGALYATLWLIPFLISLQGRPSLLQQLWASTWIAHAIGSILWCPVLALQPIDWLRIMPLAFCERLVCAILMFAVYQALAKLSHLNFSLAWQRRLL